MVPMPMLLRRRYELGEPVEKLQAREFDRVIGFRLCELSLAAQNHGSIYRKAADN